MDTFSTVCGIDITVFTEALDPDYPNEFSRRFPYSITGAFWIGNEATHDAADRIIAEAKARGASVRDDSESSQMFLNGTTAADCVTLIDVLIDQGRI